MYCTITSEAWSLGYTTELAWGREQIQLISPYEFVEYINSKENFLLSEINSLNIQLDQLNNALDKLEQKNNDLHAQLVELLEENKQAREQFLQIRIENLTSDDKQESS